MDNNPVNLVDPLGLSAGKNVQVNGQEYSSEKLEGDEAKAASELPMVELPGGGLGHKKGDKIISFTVNDDGSKTYWELTPTGANTEGGTTANEPSDQKNQGSMAERKEAVAEEKAKQREESSPKSEAQRDKKQQLKDKTAALRDKTKAKVTEEDDSESASKSGSSSWLYGEAVEHKQTFRVEANSGLGDKAGSETSKTTTLQSSNSLVTFRTVREDGGNVDVGTSVYLDIDLGLGVFTIDMTNGGFETTSNVSIVNLWDKTAAIKIGLNLEEGLAAEYSFVNNKGQRPYFF